MSVNIEETKKNDVKSYSELIFEEVEDFDIALEQGCPDWELGGD
ncbi:MAG: hypothetical protein ACE3JQ_05505 [Paenisporosarcina sp.]